MKIPSSRNKTNVEVANEVLTALNSNLTIPKNKIMVEVESGWVTLQGELPWDYQRVAAHKAIKYLNGVKGVTNNIKIKSETEDAIEQKDIESALARNWLIDSHDIQVKVEEKTVTLSGNADSWPQKEEAQRIAYNCPGVLKVINDLTIDYYPEFVK